MTIAGARLLASAREIIAAADAGLAAVAEAAAEETRVLRVGTLTSIGRNLYPRALDLFFEHQPSWRVDLRSVSWDDPLAGLGDRQMEAAFIWLPTSGDTLVRILRSIPPPPSSTPSVMGIDDFALRRGRVYGTVIVDLETHRLIDLFEERSADAVVPWLHARPTLTVIARDRAQEYARAASEGAPQATQVVDRFHLLVNLRETIERSVQRLRPALRQLLADDAPDQPAPAPSP